MKKILISLLMVVALGCTTSCTTNVGVNAYEKALEEWNFDYDNEEILYCKSEGFKTEERGYWERVAGTDDARIIYIFGEKHYAIYIYKDGEIYNYVNGSC